MNTLYHTPLRAVTIEDIPEEYRDIAEAVGLEAYLTLSVLCGGQNLYIPKREALERQEPGNPRPVQRGELPLPGSPVPAFRAADPQDHPPHLLTARTRLT